MIVLTRSDRGVGAQSRCVALLLSACLAAAAGPLAAQREPVLKQIREPHSYYYREMYLPQVTSGPSGATWSPDGRELIYSMQGTLWRQRIGSTEAQQLTDGPGYDYQPDWSPDGRWVVYTSYAHDALDLRLLDLTSGESSSLVANGAVNVEPRWSPDGGRIAFVSTADSGRWHVDVLATTDGNSNTGAAKPERLTEDRDSKLPRYYYSVFDQYLSPAWSPDGKELMLISNRDRVWGSGAFWRMAAKPGAPMRLIHDEETTWKARPDWSRDGKRVVYSSYFGRQRNQLWLMTADGEHPFQLTYGDFDAVNPRWSPDGRRIAYISNEGGNTSLWIVDVPGGARQPVTAAHRLYRAATARLRIATVDRATGRPIAARVSVTGPDGRAYAPDDAWRHADDGFDRAERPFEFSYFHSTGSAELIAPAGEVTIEVTHGPEYRVERRTLMLAGGSTRLLRIPLVRIANPGARGWISADLHVHMNYGGHYLADPSTLRRQAEAEDLRFVENLIVNKEGRVPDIARFTGRPDVASTPTTLIVHDQEYHTSFWGHLGLLGLGSHVILPGYAGYARTAAASLSPTNAEVSDLAHAQGAIVGYVHPFDAVPDPSNEREAVTAELPVDIALGKVDYMEIVAFSDPRATAEVWYRLLNCGFRIPAGAGTDAMSNFASLRGPVGLNRVYLRAGPGLDRGRLLAALKAGRSFATNGPLLDFSLDGRMPGAEIRVPPGPRRLRVRATLRSYVPVDHFEIVGSGGSIVALPLNANRMSATVDTVVTVDRSGWYTLRAWNDRATHPVLDLYPFATTSPIYVTMGGEAVRSAQDAAYFVAWIDRLSAAARASSDWNSAAERDGVLRATGEAREVFAAQTRH